MKDMILTYLQQHGPSLPVEVSSDMEEDSLIVSAMLSELTHQKLLIHSRMHIGSVSLYALPSQADALRERLRSEFIQEPAQGAIARLEREHLIMEDEARGPERKAFDTAPDFAEPLRIRVEGREVLCWAWHGLTDDEVRTLVERKLMPAVDEPKAPEPQLTAPVPAPAQTTLPVQRPPPRPGLAPAPPPPKEGAPGEVTPSAAPLFSLLKGWGLDVLSLEEERKGTAYGGLVGAATPAGVQTYILRYRNLKKQVGPTDLMEAYVQGVESKTPVLFISASGFSDKARKYHQENFPNFILLVEGGV
ncbi:MAG: hypothetical protein QF415_08395 [Candidatus Undinarchaeales archaeon]|jgi:hypothetical protein|nr:hypothetical protein [Candidatus Undinarchaeales archaeon]MDP7493657.1 hypothetical protein [Candidatus Undinarchaeales archaeon]